MRAQSPARATVGPEVEPGRSETPRHEAHATLSRRGVGRRARRRRLRHPVGIGAVQLARRARSQARGARRRREAAGALHHRAEPDPARPRRPVPDARRTAGRAVRAAVRRGGEHGDRLDHHAAQSVEHRDGVARARRLRRRGAAVLHEPCAPGALAARVRARRHARQARAGDHRDELARVVDAVSVQPDSRHVVDDSRRARLQRFRAAVQIRRRYADPRLQEPARKSSTLDDIQGKWSSLSSALGGPSLDSILGQLGGAGRLVTELRDERSQIISQANDFNSLSRTFAPLQTGRRVDAGLAVEPS